MEFEEALLMKIVGEKMEKWVSLHISMKDMIGYGVDPYLGSDEIRSSNSIIILIVINYLFNHTF